MRHVKIKTKTYKDNTGKSIDLPTLLVEYNGKVQVLEQLLKYQLKYHIKSRSWHNKLIQVVELLLDYLYGSKSRYCFSILLP